MLGSSSGVAAIIGSGSVIASERDEGNTSRDIMVYYSINIIKKQYTYASDP
jgi:hypothetical protein